MHWEILAPYLIITASAVAGLVISQILGAVRNHRLKMREIRILALLEAYRNLETAVSRPDITGTKFADGFESSLAEIQLLGTAVQSRMAKDLANALVSSTSQTSASSLLISLRDEIRAELDLETLMEPPVHFRLNRADTDKV